MLVADQVDAGDVDANSVGRPDAHRLAMEVFARGDQPFGNDPVAQDLLLAVDVVEEHLQGLDPLGDSTFELRPFSCRDDSGNHIEGKGALLPRQRERDALIDEGPTESVDAGVEVGTVVTAQGLVDPPVRSANLAVVVEHLVERAVIRARGVAVEDATRLRNAFRRGLLGRRFGTVAFRPGHLCRLLLARRGLG